MTVTTSSTEDPVAAAVALAARGDEAAFTRIVRAHHDDMTRVCFAICRDLDLADEAVQTAWPIAWRKLGTLREPERLRPWLVSIAANEARRLLRGRRRRTVVEISTGLVSQDSAEDPAARVSDLDLAAAYSRLAPDDRALLALRYVAGFDSTELGRALGKSPSGTRARLARLLDRLRSELSDD
jgi:RNA polymerase sigma factor (sigma-70 family)